MSTQFVERFNISDIIPAANPSSDKNVTLGCYDKNHDYLGANYAIPESSPSICGQYGVMYIPAPSVIPHATTYTVVNNTVYIPAERVSTSGVSKVQASKLAIFVSAILLSSLFYAV